MIKSSDTLNLRSLFAFVGKFNALPTLSYRNRRADVPKARFANIYLQMPAKKPTTLQTLVGFLALPGARNLLYL